MSKGTTHRSIRVDSELWEAARIAAEAEGRNISDVIRQLLREWIASR
jgi:antitoxin component of RelBE/YafQ-DinJ toxin-antitoxin module